MRPIAAIGWFGEYLRSIVGRDGLRPLAPGFQRVEWRPQLADLERLEVTAHTVRGPLHFRARGTSGNRELTLEMPKECEREILLPRGASVTLERVTGPAPDGTVRYRLPSGQAVRLRLS